MDVSGNFWQKYRIFIVEVSRNVHRKRIFYKNILRPKISFQLYAPQSSQIALNDAENVVHDFEPIHRN